MEGRNCLILTQYRNDPDGEYNDFLGKYYHFPNIKNYLNEFHDLPLEVVFLEPEKKGAGEFYAYGKVEKAPFIDKKNSDHYFVEITDFKEFSKPVYFKNGDGEILEKIHSAEFYNYNNSVRKIKSHFLDELCLDGGILLNFKADAHLIKVLGEQLIGSEKVGILELIKNAIDANANYCRVRLEKIRELDEIDSSEFEFNDYKGPVIVIEDDGVGMDKSTIENGWLRPASTLKTNIKHKIKEERERAEKEGKLGSYNIIVDQIKKENNGKIPLGEKGVGRFATHRLGRHLTLITKVKGADYENVLKIDWDRFDTATGHTDLDKIGVELTRQKPSRKYGPTDSGTRIIVYGGREGFEWGKEKIDDINQSILRLNSPNPNPKQINSKFKAFLECPQYSVSQEQVFENYSSNFNLQALVSANGIAEELTIKFNPPKSLNAPMLPEEWNEQNFDLTIGAPYWTEDNGIIRKPVCGAFYVSINAWYRRKEWIEGPDWKELTGYLDEYGGISVYRDNILISSAEDGTRNDWLGLTVRNIKQGFRISYYSLIGNIEIEQTENFDLIDKTNREGMVENTAFKDLGQLVYRLVELLEIKFMGKRDEYSALTKGLIRDPKKLGNVISQNSVILDGVINHYNLEKDPWQILHDLGENINERKDGLVNLDRSIKNLKKSIELIEDVQERLTEHAGFGIAAAVSLHELTKITSNFYNGMTHLLDAGKFDERKMNDLKFASASLKSELKRLSPLRSVRNENRKEFSVLESINYAQEVFKRKLDAEKIQFLTNENNNFQIFGRFTILNQIITNLVDNSIYWISNSKVKERKIYIHLDNKHRTLIIADSGPGIHDTLRPYLFEPGYSLKVPPSGLGLYICKYFMNSMSGSIYETSQKERILNCNGAQFTLDFLNVPSKKEFAIL